MKVGSKETNSVNETKSVNSVYIDAMQWLDTIPHFDQNRKKEIINMEVTDIEQIYKGIKGEYKRLSKQNKKPKAGWVYKAFTERWQFTRHLQVEKKKIIETEIKQKIEAKREEVENYINDNGGVNNVFYSGKIVEIMENYGLYIVEENVLEVWNDVDMKLLK